MTRARVSLENFISEYSVRNKANEDIPVYSVTNSQGFCTEYFGKEVASKDKTTYKIVPKGYFAYNPSRINVGSVDWQRSEDKVIVSPLYNVFSVSDEIDRQYLYYFLRSDFGKQMIKFKASGSVRDNLKLEMLKEMTIPDISMREQCFCASILDKLQLLIQLRQNELQKLDDLIKSRFVEMFGMPGADIKGWRTLTLGQCCELNPKKTNEIKLKHGLEVSFVPMSAVSEIGEIDASDIRRYDDVKTGFTYFAENDVLFAKITPCMENGKGAVAKGLRNGIGFGSTEFHVLRPLSEKSNPYWLYSLISFEIFRKDAAENMTGSAGQRRVPLTFLDNYKVSLPPIELQNQFAYFVHQVDKLKSVVQKSLDETQILFDSLMQKYFG